MTSLIEQYTQLLLQFGSPNHPTVLAFVRQFSSTPGFLGQVGQISRAFRKQSSLSIRQQASVQNLANAFLLLAQARIGPSGSIESGGSSRP